MGSEPRFIIIGVPQPLAWAVAVRNSPVVELDSTPPADMVGAYAAIYAAGPYAQDAATALDAFGVGAPREGEEPAAGVVAIGRVQYIGPPSSTIPGERWCRSGAGVWLHGVFSMSAPLFEHSITSGAWAELTGENAVIARQAYHEVVASMLELVAFTPAERLRMSPQERARRVEVAFATARRGTKASEFESQLRSLITG